MDSASEPHRTSPIQGHSLEFTKQSSKKKTKLNILRNILDNIKQNNIHITEVLEEEEIYLKKEWLKTYLPGERNRHPGPESPESFKQNEPKEIDTKTYYN